MNQYRYLQPFLFPGQFQPQSSGYGAVSFPVKYQHSLNGASVASFAPPQLGNAIFTTCIAFFCASQALQSGADVRAQTVPLLVRIFYLTVQSEVPLNINRYEALKVVGALQCKVKINGALANFVLDSGSGISPVLRELAVKHRFSTFKWKGPLVTTMDRSMLKI